MILKKPYAFLIKYFKLINFVISILAVYIAYKNYNIISFFSEYISNHYTGNYYAGFYNSYISPFVILILIILFLLLGGILLLFKYKKKPAKIYVFSLVYYLIILIYLIFIKNIMITLESSVLTAETTRLYRDISIIIFIPQITLIILFIIRALGFNIKKFNFDKDIKELEIEENDNEEVEITLKKDNVKLKRNINRFIREFKYYIKENKFMFSIICLVLLVFLAFFIYKMLPEIVDKKYNQGDIFTISGLTYKIEDSIITNLNYKGEYLDNEKYYVVVKIAIENNQNSNIELDYNDFRLVVNNTYVYPSMDKGKNFIDYAKDNYDKEIKANSKGIYSLVYEINESDVKKNYQIKIASGSVISDNLLVGQHNYITISPIIINKVQTEAIINEGETLKLSNTNLGSTTLKLSNPVITDKYIYEYEYCTNSSCNTYKDMININYLNNNTALIVLDYEFELDSTVPFYSTSSNINTFIATFVTVKYINTKNEYVYSNIKNVTPSKLKNKIVIETTKDIQESDSVELSITIRNKEYLIKLK